MNLHWSMRVCWHRTLFAVLLFTLGSGVLTSDDELKEFVLHPSCKMELVAKEPQVVDPIAVRFDEKGRMWVVEMRDYPTLIHKTPRSKIKILRDLDQDGFFETADVFADNLIFPTGLQPWKNGVIATLEGQVVYLADNDGDLRCDEERVLFSGFATQNTQLRANHPTFGPDGKVYIANGLRNGKVRSPISDKQISLTGMDFRFDPVSNEFEAVTGHGQFGMTFDSSSNRYVCTNRNPLKRIVFEAEYLKASSGVRVTKTVVDVASAGPESRLFPICETWTTSNLHANQFTAACGVHVFTDILLSGEFVGNAFTCDPTANIVHREVISYQSDTVVGTSRPGRSKIEFLASSKSEFRPVNINGGPDGALYVVDMRRAVIEHPQFMPPELKNRPDLRVGNNKGRIYRILAKSANPKYGPPAIRPAKDLFSRSTWRREQAHRLLKQNLSEVDVNAIRQELAKPESHPEGIVRGLSILKTLNKLRPIDYEFAASHFAVSVRTNAMRLCENIRPDLIRAAINDESDKVRFQALLSCVKSKIELTAGELATVAFNSAQNPWVQQAWLMAAQPQASQVLKSLVDGILERKQKRKFHTEVVLLCSQLVPIAWRSNAVEAGETAEYCLSKIAAERQELDRLALAFLKLPLVRWKLLASKKIKWRKLREFLSESIRAGDQVARRLRLLALTGSNHPIIEDLAVNESNSEYRIAAIRALQFSNRNETWYGLVKRFRSLTFAERDEVLSACFVRKEVAEKMLSEIESGRLKVSELGINARKRLLAHRDQAIKTKAAKVLAIQVPADREKAYEKYRVALDLKADAKRGRLVFEKNCASCHQLGLLGNRIGPDISDTRTKSKSQLLLDIIRPNAAIDNNYVEYLIATNDGRTVNGILVESNATGITIRQADNKSVSIPSEDVERIQSTGKSLMPVGLEQDLTTQQVADLISYLQNWRYLESNIPYQENSNAK